jgi:hypothetical protein
MGIYVYLSYEFTGAGILLYCTHTGVCTDRAVFYRLQSFIVSFVDPSEVQCHLQWNIIRVLVN